MSRCEVTARLVIDGGELVHVEIRQDQPASTAGVFWPRPRSINKAMRLLRSILALERRNTAEVTRA